MLTTTASTYGLVMETILSTSETIGQKPMVMVAKEVTPSTWQPEAATRKSMEATAMMSL